MSTIPSQPGAFRSLFWKETWQLKEFFLAMIVLGGLLQMLVAGLLISFGDGATTQQAMYSVFVIGGFAALFASACGATLFATEKEERTFRTCNCCP